MHTETILFEGALIIVLGIVAQWASWRLRLPSILFLLVTGILVGPITGILHINETMGELLFPFVSVSVAIILFEGGLSLRLKDLRGTEGVVRNLVTIGVLVTWAITGVAAYFLLGLNVAMSLLLGATLVVTGPTVIIPLLNQIRPSGRVSSILRWEGIIIDPVGAILALLVFEEIFVTNLQQGLALAAVTLVRTLLIGIIIGIITGNIIIELYRRYWVPDNLQNAGTLMFVIAAFALSNFLQAEAGLLTVTVMGIVMANQKRFNFQHVIEFKESLQVLLLGALFIMLSARMPRGALTQIASLETLLFVAIIIFIERPLAAFISTIGSDLTWRERLFIGWMAPRGIVAASVASIFALELVELEYPGAELLVPYTFAVIIGTVIVYSLSSGVVARRLGLSESNPQGLLIVGASEWVQQIALQIRSMGIRVLLTDTNQSNIDQASAHGLETYLGSVISEMALDEIDLSGLGRLVAMTPNSEVNALAAEHFENVFGHRNTYELPRPERDRRGGISPNIGGTPLFHSDTTYDYLQTQYMSGAQITTISANLFQNTADVLPLFVLTEDRELLIWTVDNPPRLLPTHKVIAFTNLHRLPEDFLDTQMPRSLPIPT
ncbi:sodium:proton antiporter [Phototrophicus methaneseepsis]|uniref:Sodium:proton antiporter n=1 Tax=Phototrophicus methaneseepsis TaxID=2710758 RepID=A0A7S8EBA5_9CHLR|nr:sodium:proton antiporter [Phototrophicus methaneseepsis]QPC83812.1 sodium:proton antiporter [Phototrophicus methaneseepsis]